MTSTKSVMCCVNDPWTVLIAHATDVAWGCRFSYSTVIRQPYLREKFDLPAPDSMPNTDHVHHYGWYIGNYPELPSERIEWLGEVLKTI